MPALLLGYQICDVNDEIITILLIIIIVSLELAPNRLIDFDCCLGSRIPGFKNHKSF